MKIVGQFNKDGEYRPHIEPVIVRRLGNSLVDKHGTMKAVKDEYGHWVSPTMRKYGVKCVIKVED